MELKQPGGVDEAIDSLTELATSLKDCAHSPGAQEMRERWLTWWRAADKQLEHLFADGNMTRSLYSTRNDLSALAIGPGLRSTDALQYEIRVWTQHLKGAIAELQSLKSFLAIPGELVVLDTSAFIEGTYFADADWQSMCGLGPRETARLIVPIIVIEELDDLKRNRNSRVSDRARSVLRKLWQLHEENSTAPVELPGRRATVEVLLDSAWHVRRAVNDDEIIIRAAFVHTITGNTVTLASGDNAMLYRAGAVGLRPLLISREEE